MQHNPYQAPVAAGPYAAQGGGLSTGSYEFDDIENATIAKMGRRAWWWGLISMISGVVGVVMLAAIFALQEKLAAHGIASHYITIGIVALAPIVLTNLVIAFNYMGAGSSLKAVVATQGNDIEHLMQSLSKLGTAFMVEFIVGMIAIAIGFAAGLYFSDVEIDESSINSFNFDD